MKELNSNLMKKILKRASESVEGDWVLLGGTLPQALGIDIRATVDIDLVPVKPSGNVQMVALMTIAEEFNLPVETINMAAGFFLRKIKNYEQELVPILEGRKSRILRPTLSLYLKLKSERFSESDLKDCEAMIKYIKKLKIENELIDAKKTIKQLSTKKPDKFKALIELFD